MTQTCARVDQMSAEFVGPIAVVAVTYNSASLLPDFFAAVELATARFTYELVIVDNCSTDNTVSLVRDLAPHARLIQADSNGGYAYGINRAIATCKPASHVLVLNPDVCLLADTLVTLVKTADGDSTVGIVVPRLAGPDGQLSYSLRREPTVLRALGEAILGGMRAGRFARFGEMITDPRQYDNARSADWATGACMLLTNECVRQVGEWDESFFLYSEETDFALRARDLGFRLHYQPVAHAVHQGGEAHCSPFLFRLLTVNRLRLYRRRHGSIATFMFRFAMILGLVPRAIRRPTARAALVGLFTTSGR